MDPNQVKALFTNNPFGLIKKTAIVLTAVFLLITFFKWSGYINDSEFHGRLSSCAQTSGGHGEYNDCIIYPTKDHQAKRASATLYTYITIFIPAVIFGSYYAYVFFFIKKRPDI